MKKFKWKTILISFFITSCTTLCEKRHEDLSAEEVVKIYLNTALSMTRLEERNILLDLTKGRLNQAIATATDETIKEAYLKKIQVLEKFQIIETNQKTPRESEITFQLIYKEPFKGKQEKKELVRITTQNTVLMIKEDKKWFIREVVGNKTSIDFPVSELSIIRGLN